MLHLTCSTLPRGFGPQKNTPASAGAWIFRMDLNMASQLGRPKLVAARNPVMVSVSAFASLIMMLVASSDLILAVRYYGNCQMNRINAIPALLTVCISMWLSKSCASIAMSNDRNHSKDPKSRQTQKKYTFWSRVFCCG